MEEKVSLKSKLWLSGADGFCGILCGLVTGGGLTYFVPGHGLWWRNTIGRSF